MESDLEKYQQQDFGNWMYLRFKTVSELDSLFYENYLFGGIYLSIIKDDLIAAAKIFDLGLEQFPDDYRLNYNAGFNYYFELGNFEKGLKYLKKIEHHPKTPNTIKNVIMKLSYEISGNYDLAIAIIKENIKSTEDIVFKEKLEQDLYAISAQKDLECLNNKNNDCNSKDLHGHHYIKNKEGLWTTVKPFTPYKVFRRN